jgi:rRNA-processing protein FCF1
MKAGLILNLHEIGMSEWEDRKNEKMIIRMTMDDQTMHHPVSWNVKYISIIMYNTAGEESMTPYIVISQDSELFRKKLMHHGVRMGIDFVLRQCSK